MSAKFLNANLDIFSDQDLQLLIDEISDRAFLLYGGPFSEDLPFAARYEIDYGSHTETAESLILAFCELVEGLSPASRSLWESARERIIDLGYELLASGSRAYDRVSSLTLNRMSALKIHLAWTFYPADEKSKSSQRHDENGSITK